MRHLGKLLFLMALTIPATALLAQTKISYEVKNGTVVAVFNDQLVVRMANGETKEITVPAGFKFTIDGKQVNLGELKPGTQLTAVITTTKTPQTVKTVQIKNGEVLKVMGNTVWFRHEGKLKSYQAPDGFNVMVDGRKVSVNDLLPGYKLTAEFVYTSEKTLTEREVEVSGKPPAPPS
jgi:RNase P/RNase MRP subunit p29